MRSHVRTLIAYLSAEEHEKPDGAQQNERHEHGGRADVLGQAGQGMALESDTIHRRLDCAVDELDHESEQHRRDEQRPFHSVVAQPQCHRYDDEGDCKFLTKRSFLAESAPQAAPAGDERSQDSGGSAWFVAIDDYAFGFHLRSSCLAARTSSRRRTGMVCGALVTRSGSSSASF